MSVTARISGSDPLATLRRFRWTTLAAGWADSVIPAILKAIDEETPVRSGELQRANRVVRRSAPGSVQIEYFNNQDYAGFVIGGTKPHEILPLHVRALHFQSDRGEVFAARVMHPGTKPNPYHRRGYLKVSVLVQSMMDAKLKEMTA